MKPRAKRSSNSWWRWRSSSREVKVTTEGKFFLLLTIVLGVITVNTGLNLLYLLLALLLSVIMVSGFLSEMSLRGVTVRRRMPTELWAGQPSDIVLEVQNTKKWLPSFSLHIEDRITTPRGDQQRGSRFVLYLRPKEKAQVSYALSPASRGLLRVHGPYVSTRFPFGLFVKSRLLRHDAELLAFPELTPVRSASFDRAMEDLQGQAAIRQHSGSGNEFHSLNEFRTGDNPKWIHWRSSARQGRLMVKEFERNRIHNVNLLFDARGGLPGDPAAEEAFERAVSAAASLTCELNRRGCLILFAMETDELQIIPYGLGRGHLRRILGLLATVQPRPDAELRTLYGAIRRRGRTHALTLVLSSAASPGDADVHGRSVVLNHVSDRAGDQLAAEQPTSAKPQPEAVER